MDSSQITSEKLDFKRILPILVIVFVDLLGLSIIIPLLPLYAARYSATPLVIGILQATYPRGSVRLCVSRYTTEDEVDQLVGKLSSIVSRLREMSPFAGEPQTTQDLAAHKAYFARA
jgi:hypothetical protein